MQTLSNKLSTAIRQGLDDIRACESDPAYSINFNVWHERANDVEVGDIQTCAVCFAGSVMAQRLGAHETEVVHPSDFPEHEFMLEALDIVRKGKVIDALAAINICNIRLKVSGQEVSRNKVLMDAGLDNNVTVPDYYLEPDAWHEKLGEIADKLESLGY